MRTLRRRGWCNSFGVPATMSRSSGCRARRGMGPCSTHLCHQAESGLSHPQFRRHRGPAQPARCGSGPSSRHDRDSPGVIIPGGTCPRVISCAPLPTSKPQVFPWPISTLCSIPGNDRPCRPGEPERSPKGSLRGPETTPRPWQGHLSHKTSNRKALCKLSRFFVAIVAAIDTAVSR